MKKYLKILSLVFSVLFFNTILLASDGLPVYGTDVEIHYYTDKKYKNNKKNIYVNKNQYENLCRNTSGITKFMARSSGFGNTDFGYLLDNGDFDHWKVYYDDAYKDKECRIEMTVSGIMRGNSRRVTVRGYVSTFVMNEKGDILAHHGSAF